MENVNNATTDGNVTRWMGSFRNENRCAKARIYDGLTSALKPAGGTAMTDAMVVKQVIKGVLTGEFQKAEIADLVDEGIMGNYETPETGRRRRDELTRRIRRYLNCEIRALHVSDEECPCITVSAGGYDVRVKPDAWDDNGGTVEVIIYRIGKPDVSEKGRKRDKSVDTCLELWFLMQYAKRLVPKGEYRIIRASYYYLRKKTDKNGSTLTWDNDFFSSSGGNVVSLSDEYVAPDDGTIGKWSELDEKFLAQLEEFAEGQECSGDDCKYCMLRPACNYAKAPELSERKAAKKGGNITLSDAQEDVIAFNEGICRVNAGAGAGKTECVARRVARLIEEGEDPKNVLLITFTDAGAREMKERVAGKLLDAGIETNMEDIRATTFNAFAYDIVRKEHAMLGFPEPPEVIDDVREAVIIKDLLTDDDGNPAVSSLDYLNFTSDVSTCRGALACARAVFNVLKTEQLDPDGADTPRQVKESLSDSGHLRFISETALMDLLELYPEYCSRLKEDSLVTFADQEPLMMEILKAKPGYLEGYTHVIIDEFQDTNGMQMATVKVLASCKSLKSLMVVGDDSQSIFGFRGTGPENIVEFWDRLGMKGEDKFLVENHRSTPEILDLANKLNAINTMRVEKDLEAARPAGGEAPVIKEFWSKDEECDYLTGCITDVLDRKNEDGDPVYRPEDVAFIAATKAELVAMSAKLSEKNIPWVMKNPMKLSENPRVQAAVSLAGAFWEPEATQLYFDYLTAEYDGDILEAPEDEILEAADELKRQFSSIDMMEIPEQRRVFHEYLEAIRGDDEVYGYFLDMLYRCPDLQDELEYIKNYRTYGESMAKRMEQSYSGVCLTTAHSSKGLEWPVVAVSVSSFDTKHLHHIRDRIKFVSEAEERRRLLFVAMTRARDVLYVTGQAAAYTEKFPDGTKETGENRFLRDLFDLTGQQFLLNDPDAEKKAAERKAKAAARRKERAAAAKTTKTGSKKPGARGGKPKGSKPAAKKNDRLMSILETTGRQMDISEFLGTGA